MKSSLRLSALLVLLLLTATQSVSSVSAASTQARIAYPSAYDWPMFLHSADHNGAIMSPAPISNKEVAHVKLNGSVIASVALSNGTLFVAGGSQFRALNSSTMVRNTRTNQGWNYTVGVGLVHYPIRSSPAVGGGNVFFGASDGKVYAFEAKLDSCKTLSEACHLKWNYTTGGPVYSSPNFDQGKIFIGSDDMKVYCINASTGAHIWNYTTTGKVRSSPAVASSQVVVGSDDGSVYFLNESTGTLITTFPTSAAVESSASIANGVAYFGSNDTRVYAVNMTSHAQLWNFTTSGKVIGSPAVADGNVYVGSMNETSGPSFYALHAQAANPQMVWNEAVGRVASSPALANGANKVLMPSSTWLPVAYVSSMNGHLYAISRQTGAIQWTKTIALNTVSSPVVAYTKVYLGESDGKVTQVGSLRGGTALGTFNSLNLQSSSFHRGDLVLIGADTAWGRYGINQSLVTVCAPQVNCSPNNKFNLVNNASMLFVPGLSQYNYRYNFTLPSNAATGTYKIILLVEDGHAKGSSNIPRCCGWIVVTSSFHVSK